MSLKKAVGKIHLWLGFTSGLVVFIISVTGCLYAFQDEIQDMVETFRYVKAQPEEFLPPSVLRAAADQHLPGKHVHGVLYSGADRAAQVIYFSFDPEYYYIAYLNPYTAEVLKVKDMEADFFHIVLDGHFYLWLPPEIGQPAAATATLIFVGMLVTGLVLWWPRKKKDLKQRFRIKWKARWRRINYDMHNVPGFYALCLALILALTGLVWGFQWFAKGVYRIAGGDKQLEYVEPPSDTTMVLRGDFVAVDQIYHRMRHEYPNAKSIEVHIPETPSSPIAANANPEAGTYWKLDYRYYDQYSLEEVSVDHIYGRYAQAGGADKLMRMNYDIHTGAILGLPGKIIAFLVSLICTSLPVTGVCIWWGRRNKDAGGNRNRTPATKKSMRSRAVDSRAIGVHEKVA